MNPSEIMILVFVLTVNVVYGQAKCKALPEGYENAITLKGANEDILLTFKETEECALTVKGFNEMDFILTVSDFKITDSSTCTDSFIKADATQTNLENKPQLQVCTAEQAKTASAMSKEKTIYIKVKATNAQKEQDKTVTLKFKSINGPECGKQEVQLTDTVQTLRLPVDGRTFTKDTVCYITVNGIGKRDFTMTVPQINFKAEPCETDYVSAASTIEALEMKDSKICGTSPVTAAKASAAGIMYLKIVTTTDQSKNVAFQFKTELPECGNTEIKLTNDSMDLMLPPVGHPFQSNSLCNIRVTGMENKALGVTITQIKFPTPCKDNYVAISTTMTGLSDTNNQHCGTTPVTTPINSENGTVYVQIRTMDVTNTPTVTLNFKSGAGNCSPLAFMAMFSLNLVSLYLR